MKKEIVSGVKALLAGMLVVSMLAAAARRLLRGMRQIRLKARSLSLRRKKRPRKKK